MKNILAVDLGTKCGIAYNVGTAWKCETLLLATDKEIKLMGKNRQNRRCDCRISRLHFACGVLHFANKFDIVIFEDVQFASSTYQVQLWASLRAALILSVSVPFPQPLIECVPVGTLKLFAANHGSATKEMMSAALQRQHPNQWTATMDDNAVDAAWLWHWANQNLTRTTKDAIIPT